MNRRTGSFLFALALVGLAPEHALALGDPLSESEIAMIEARARGDFMMSAREEGLEGDAVDIVYELERNTAPILGLASTECPIRIDVDNVTDHPMIGAHFEVVQGFTRIGESLGPDASRVPIDIPYVPARTRIHARVECTSAPSYLAWESSYAPSVSRSVEFPTFSDVHGLEDEGIAAMSFGNAAFSREYDVFVTGSSLHPVLWHVIDLADAGPEFDNLLARLLAHPDGRSMVFQYLADSPYSVHGVAIASAMSELPTSQVLTVYTGLPVDVAGRALSMLDERAYTRISRVLRTTPEGRAAIISLLSVTDQPEQFAAVAATVDDATLEAAIEALAAGSTLSVDRVTLFDRLLVQARALSPERQQALALVLFTRWVDHRIPSAEIETRVLATRDMGETAVDALLRERAERADEVFLSGALRADIDAMELYRALTVDLSGCTTSMDRLATCAAVIESEPAFLAAATSGGLSPDFVSRAQTVLVDNLGDDTAALAFRYQPWGVSLAPIVERACSSGGAGEYGGSYGGSYGGYGDYGRGLSTLTSAEYLALARALDPDAECLRAMAERQQREANARYMRLGLGVLILLASIAAAALFVRRGLRRLEGVRAEDLKTHPVEDSGRIAQRIAPEPFAVALGRGLRGTETALREEAAPESDAVVKALTALRSHETELAAAAQEAVQDVIAHGKLRSTIVALGGYSVYLVVVPGMHDQPQAFRRYEAFAHGWLAHVDRLKAMLARSELPSKLLCLFLFVRPDGSETALLVAYEDGATRYLPFGLLDEEEVHAGAGRQGTHREQWSHSEGRV